MLYVRSMHSNLFLRGSLVFATVSAPFLISRHTYPYPTIWPEGVAGVLAVCLVGLLLTTKVGWKKPTEFFYYLIALSVFVLLQTLLLEDIYYPNRGYLAALYLVLVGGCVWAGQVLGSRAVAWIASGIVLGGLLNLLAANHGIGLVAQQNQLADYSTLALVSVLYLFETKKVRGLLAIVCILLLLYSVALTTSRSVLLYLLAVVGVSVWRRQDQILSSLLLLLVFGLMQYDLLQVGESTAVTRIVSTVGEAASSARLEMWSWSVTSWLDAPWFGIGFGQLLTATSEGVVDHVHNIFLQLLVETGVVGLSLLCVGLWKWFRSFKQQTKSLESWWVACCLSVLFIHSNLEYPLWYLHFLVVAALIFGIGVSNNDTAT